MKKLEKFYILILNFDNMSKELQILCETSWLTVEAMLYYDDDIVATIPCTQQDNLWYIWDMPTTLPMYEYWVGFYSNNELIWFETIMWNGVQELWFWNITTWWGGWVIDVTKKHEEIIEKYEKLMKDELKKIVEWIKFDLSPVLQAISSIPATNLSDVITGINAVKLQIKSFNKTILEDYVSQRDKIEKEYSQEIDKKNSLLKENEYNRKEKEKQVEQLNSVIETLKNTIDEMTEQHEQEMAMMDESYSEEINNIAYKAEEHWEKRLKEKLKSLID